MRRTGGGGPAGRPSGQACRGTGPPSSVRWTSTSTPPAPSSAARPMPSMLFSGACCGQARWAMMRTDMPDDIVARGPSANRNGGRHVGVVCALIGVRARLLQRDGGAVVLVQPVGIEGTVFGDGVVGDVVAVDPGDLHAGG